MHRLQDVLVEETESQFTELEDLKPKECTEQSAKGCRKGWAHLLEVTKAIPIRVQDRGCP